MIRRILFASLIVGTLAHPAPAQDVPKPVYPTPQAPAIAGSSDVPPPPPKPAEATRIDDKAKVAEARRPIVRAAPLPRRTAIEADADSTSTSRRDPSTTPGRFANPGGVGRYAEYYTANTPTSQFDMHPTHPTRFDRGAGPDRASQIASFRAGQQRTANIQNNINAYGRPYGAYGAGFGFGFGLATGGLYGGGLR